ncbi:methyltransferase domain-containing protein [Patescibacteria group bacterium]|nr:methyltransferase domain-containing protein [Patescibacteria group bacterium]
MDKTANLKHALAAAYDALRPFSDKYEIDLKRYLFSLKLLSGIEGYKNKKILDIGTGIGILPIALRKLGAAHVFGADHYVFPESGNEMFGIREIEKIKAVWHAQGVEVFDLDIIKDDLPKTLEGVGVIVSEATIEHLKAPRVFLDRIFTLLPSGGYFLLTTPNIATAVKRLRFLFGKTPLWPVQDFYKDGEDFTGHWREYTMAELEYMCRKSGFAVVDRHTVNTLVKLRVGTSMKKNAKALFTILLSFLPGSGEMHYVLCRKP